jgi:hypothetical protein
LEKIPLQILYLKKIYDIRSSIVHWNLDEINKFKEIIPQYLRVLEHIVSKLLYIYITDPEYINNLREIKMKPI